MFISSYNCISADFYKDVLKSLDDNPLARFLWKNVLKAVMLGVIPYSPDAPVVKKIIKKASIIS